MAKLIVKSPYLRSGAGAGGCMKYIATRENVELLPDSRPVTAKQRQLIDHILEDFPDAKDLPEYEQMALTPSVTTASRFLSAALEVHEAENSDHSDIYLRYIATRPHVEKQGSHGLFGDEPKVDLPKAMAELEQYPGKVWTHILSLTREDAVRLCYDNAESWRNLLKCHRNDIADAMGIPPKNFRWYAAFHDEGDHPHVHMMAWSADPKQGYLGKDGIRQIKSVLMNDIFQQETLSLYQRKSVSRDELVAQARTTVRNLAREMCRYVCDSPEAEALMSSLAAALETVKGKKTYGYLPHALKRTVDGIVDELAKQPEVAHCYEVWWDLQCQIKDYYGGESPDRPPLSQQKEFRAIKNAIIREADALRLGIPTFEDAPLDTLDEPLEIPEPDSFDLQSARWIMENGDSDAEEAAQAIETLKRLWQQENSAQAAWLLGKAYRDGAAETADPQAARVWLRRSAEAGDPRAAYALGMLLLKSPHPETALPYLQRAVETDSPFAQYQLGKLLLAGELLPKDTERAIRLWKASAANGNAYAQFALGRIYLTGREVPQDTALAEDYLLRAEEQGHPYAQLYLDTRSIREDPAVLMSVTQLVYHLSRIFQDRAAPSTSPALSQLSSLNKTQRQILQEKRIALGHKPNDHEDPGFGGMTMG